MAEANLKKALSFFEQCDRGDGWENCKQYCAPGATFRGQAGAFHPPATTQPNLGGYMENYVDWMKMIAKAVMPNCYSTDVVSGIIHELRNMCKQQLHKQWHTNLKN